MKKSLALMITTLSIASTAFAQQSYQSPYYDGNTNSVQHQDPLFGLSPDPWSQYSNTGAVGTERVSTPWNQTTYYPVPPTDEYIGGKTTWGDSQGQVEIAPEANIHNMLVMTNHLRKLGYQIPEGFDEGVRNAPAHYHQKIMSSLEYMSHDHGDPISKSASGFINIFEDQTGFSIYNLIDTSLGIIGN